MRLVLISANYGTVLKKKDIGSLDIRAMRLQLVQKVENAHEDSIWTVSWVPGKKQFVTGSVDENVNIWEESGSAEEVAISQVHTLVRLGCFCVEFLHDSWLPRG